MSHSTRSSFAFLATVSALVRSRARQGLHLCRAAPRAARWVVVATIRCVRLLSLALLAVGGVVLWLVASAVAAAWVLGARGLARLR